VSEREEKARARVRIEAGETADGLSDTMDVAVDAPGDAAARTLEKSPLGVKDTVPAPAPVPDASANDSADASANDSAGDDRGGRLGITLVDSDDDDPITAEEPIADPLIGLVVAERYRIIERIGRGGMGIVYKVEHSRIGKLLAMKLLAGELSTNKEVVRRFKLEALTVSKLSSPHTVQVFDYGVWNHLTYLVMELVEGHDLSRPLRRSGPIPFARLGKLMVQVCASLAEAHEKGITHRDIKPENIMIVTDTRGVEVAKVLDFGLAKLRENAELNELTLQGAVVGTPYFMSPEQVYGEEVDGRTDIYSLGAVMFKALTGTYPFQAKSPMGMFTKHLTEEPPSACERAPELGIPEGVSAAVQKCMAKEPAKRFQTIEALRDCLVEELALLPHSSSDRVLDEVSGEHPQLDSLRRKRERERADVLPTPELGRTQIATRRELERYERQLRRNRYAGWAVLALILAGGAVFGGWALRNRLRFTGSEREPNNQAVDANALPLGEQVAGYLGKRTEEGAPDRDFYVFDVPERGASHLSLRVTALPNIPLCAVLYRVGFQQQLAQYCTGSPGQDLEVVALRIDPGAHYVAVTQDLSGERAYVHENISDSYALVVAAAQPAAGDEIEPNDALESHQAVAAGSEVTGTLGWVGDADVFCVATGFDGAIAWEIGDGKRKDGTVIEATPVVGGAPLPVARVHAEGSKPYGKPQHEADVASPWMSPVYASSRGARCIELRLTADPWARVAVEPLPDATRYTVRVLNAD
jgi:serine/threonine-protein kinase